jgi:hypothetical protein
MDRGAPRWGRLTALTVTGTSITSDKFDYDCDGL